MGLIVAVCAFVLIVQHLPSGRASPPLAGPRRHSAEIRWEGGISKQTSDLCGYTQDTTDDQDWTRHSGQTPITNTTGSSVDHTLGTALGYYMYLEASAGDPGDVARLVSPPIPANSAPYCLRFYYHMFGDSSGTLNVYIRKQGILGSPVWTVSGNHGNVWQFGHAQLDGSSSFNVAFEAVRGNVALDDVTVSDECVPIATKGTAMRDNLSAGQTKSNTIAIIVVIAIVVLSLVCGVVLDRVVAGVVATVCYKKKKRTRSGHAEVTTEENRPASAVNSSPSVVSGRVDFENPTFEPIYEELPNVVANHTTSGQDQRPLSAISSAQTEVYMEINDHEVCGAEGSSQQPAPATSLPAEVSGSSPSPRQDHQGVRQHGGHRERNAEDGHTRQGYGRDGWETEDDYLTPLPEPNVPGPNSNLNQTRSNDEDYERIRTDPYQNLNPRSPAHYESLRPDHYQKLNVPERAPNPDGYQSLRHNQYQELNGPLRSRDDDRSDYMQI
ncbi:hypothetical protein Bbelb_327130 [Branchiostoma belcheri]|nr:hypothetical protein Bbelb_327130 [Branchiostoma belcheri]